MCWQLEIYVTRGLKLIRANVSRIDHAQFYSAYSMIAGVVSAVDVDQVLDPSDRRMVDFVRLKIESKSIVPAVNVFHQSDAS